MSPVRDMSPEDRRRATIEVAGLTDARLIVTAQPPVIDETTGEPVPVVTLDERDDEHRGLQHLDGTAETRPPAEWERENSFTRFWTGVGDREDHMARLRRDREALPLHTRLRVVEQERARLQHTRAQQRRETDARTATEGTAIPSDEGDGAIGGFHPGEVDGRLTQIRLHVEALEEMVDQHKGLSFKSWVLMSQQEKDALLTGPRMRGLSPEEIHAVHPELGAPITIRRVRSAAGQDPRGNPRPRPTVALRDAAANRRPWEPVEDEAIRARDVPDGVLAERFGRTENAIRVRRARLRAENAVPTGPA